MSGIEVYAISSLATAISSSPGRALTSWLCHQFLKWKLKKKLFGIVLLKGCSTICQKLSSDQILFFDVDVLYHQLVAPKSAEEVNKKPTVLENYTAYPILRTHLYNLSKVYKNRIVIVSKSLELLKALGIYDDHLYFYAFSKEMEEKVGLIYTDEKVHKEAEVNKFRIKDQMKPSNVVIIESMADLESKLKTQFAIEVLNL
jgi:hypothetical protein